MKNSMKISKILLIYLLAFFYSNAVCAAGNPEAELKAILSPLESLQGNFKQQISNEQGKILQQCKLWTPNQYLIYLIWVGC